MELYEKSAVHEYIKWAIEQCANINILTAIHARSLTRNELEIQYRKQKQIEKQHEIELQEQIEKQHETNDFKTNFDKIVSLNKYKCKLCSKIINNKYMKSHTEQSCRKGLNILQCKYCERFLSSSSSKCDHQKVCKIKIEKETNNINTNTNRV
jgi:hypothetical protein